MTELALTTVEITVTDRDSQGFGLGGPKEHARAMSTALAQRLNMAPPPDGRLLNVSITAAELRPIDQLPPDTKLPEVAPSPYSTQLLH